MVFGDVASTRPWQADPRVEVHGPGYSKVVLGPDASADWERTSTLMASLDRRERRALLHQRLGRLGHRARARDRRSPGGPARGGHAARDRGRPEAQLAPFADPEVAERISAMIDRELEAPGAEDVTARLRGGSRVARRGKAATYLLPTLVLCDSPEHPLANREFLFPFASVVPVRPEEIPARLGPTLAVTAITADQALLDRLLASPLVHRLNLGALPTCEVAWDQPHEGNLFEHLYARRALLGRAGVA